ncbi:MULTISPECIES: porin family protein [Tenacibaculum]|uniref:porin family protein n=1 Tax=Tenacibaculum TaxID=104267 RepID=UPI00089C3CFC|nr:porin family protein [Tenacibaculum sp. MAR_2010_89]SEE60498.1 Outer membrane protein beta-barrel domain-containing protein [Tenacibaculum sp. MAR_2010_89]
MKKIAILVLFLLGVVQVSQSQIQFGIKGGINYNSDSFQEVKTDVLDGAKSKTGFHIGVLSRIKIPVIGLYVQPELVYTSLKSEISAKNSDEIASYNFQKIDIPVLLGKKFLKVAHVFVGPSFQYIIDGDFSLKSLNDVKTDVSGFTVGLQLGAGVELGKIGLDVRWERAFSDTESQLINSNGAPNVNFDTRVNQIIVGLSYRF